MNATGIAPQLHEPLDLWARLDTATAEYAQTRVFTDTPEFTARSEGGRLVSRDGSALVQSALAAVNAGHEWKRYEIVATDGEIVVSRKLTAFGQDGYQQWIDDQWLADELEWRLGGASA